MQTTLLFDRGSAAAGLVALCWAAPQNATATPVQSRPNILLIITDDQGYGDLGFHGNPKIRTPQLDRRARESVQFQYFYVSPVCSPTRASPMTERGWQAGMLCPVGWPKSGCARPISPSGQVV